MTMKKILFLLALALLPVALFSQADQKLIAKANSGDTRSMLLLATCYENGCGVAKDSVTAFQWYKKAAELGNAEAELCMSRFYLKGIGVAKDTARYFAIRQESANKKYPNGIAALGYAYLYGLGVKTDTVRAIELFEQAAKMGSSWACSFIGTSYAFGEYGYPNDPKKAEQYKLKALKFGGIDGEEELAYFYAQREDYKNVWKYLPDALKMGSPLSRILESQLLFNGHGVAKNQALALQKIIDVVTDFPDYPLGLRIGGVLLLTAENPMLRDSLKAVSFFRRGVNLNDNSCRFLLADQYIYNGMLDSALLMYNEILNNKSDQNYKEESCFLGGNIWRFRENPDAERALELYHLGVDKYKSASCARALADYYAETEEADEFGDDNLVMSYYNKAFELGDTTALVELGKYCAFYGDYEHAEETFQRMVASGYYDGYCWLAAIYSSQDEDKALAYLRQGDKKGNAICRESLGRIYEDGMKDDEPDFKKAEKYYLLASTAGSYDRLGKLYLAGSLGKQSPKDIQKGVAYLEKAAEMGNVEAMYSLGYIYETGNYIDTVDGKKALKYYSLLADNGMPDGLFKMGQYYENGEGGLNQDSLKAVDYYRKAADMGHGEAMCFLGDFYRIGQFLPLDKNRAFQYYSMADSVGEEMGTYYVGRSYLEGCGVAVDTSLAIPYLKAAAEAGIGRAAYLIGDFYNFAKGGLQSDGDSALRYYISAYKNGNSDAAYILGLRLYSEGEYKQSFNLIYYAAKNGNPKAIFRIASYIQDGIGVEADPVEAYKLFEYAAHSFEVADAYSQMGLARLQGNGCKQDEQLGKKYLDTASAMGSSSGKFYLALCYFNGYGCDPDSLMADRLLHESADSGYVRAMNLLGELYENQDDFEKAFHYYEKAAERGSWDGYCNLGYCYEKGQGVILSYKKAVELYRKAADEGSLRGMKMLANCYLEGIGVEKDSKQVIALLEKAASMGDAPSMYYLGQLYEEGEDDFPKDKKKAKEWYKKAADLGYQPAKDALSHF